MKHKKKKLSLIQSFNLLKPKSKLIAIYGVLLGLGILGLAGYGIYTAGHSLATYTPTAGNVSGSVCEQASFLVNPPSIKEGRRTVIERLGEATTNVYLRGSLVSAAARDQFLPVQISVFNKNNVIGKSLQPVCIPLNPDLDSAADTGVCPTGSKPLVIPESGYVSNDVAIVEILNSDIIVNDSYTAGKLADNIELRIQITRSLSGEDYSSITTNCNLTATFEASATIIRPSSPVVTPIISATAIAATTLPSPVLCYGDSDTPVPCASNLPSPSSTPLDTDTRCIGDFDEIPAGCPSPTSTPSDGNTVCLGDGDLPAECASPLPLVALTEGVSKNLLSPEKRGILIVLVAIAAVTVFAAIIAFRLFLKAKKSKVF